MLRKSYYNYKNSCDAFGVEKIIEQFVLVGKTLAAIGLQVS